jgi:hypothetical protein
VQALTYASLPEIGRSFGGKHHSTVIHSIKKVEALRKTDLGFNTLLNSFLKHSGEKNTFYTGSHRPEEIGCGSRKIRAKACAGSGCGTTSYQQKNPQFKCLKISHLQPK